MVKARKNWKNGLVSEAKLGCCKICGSKFHRAWQCRENPKNQQKIQLSMTKPKSSPASCKRSTRRVKHRTKTTRPQLIKNYDALFSKYLRKKAELNRQLFCFTCGKRLTYDTAVVMHFISRRYISIRFDEDNVHIGCRKCNTPDKDQPMVLAKYASLLGQDVVEHLNEKKMEKISTVQLQANYEQLKKRYNDLLSSREDK